MLVKRRMSTVAVGAAALTCLTSVAGAVGAQAATPARDALAGSALPSMVRQHPAGSVAKSAAVNFELVLKLRDASAAQALVRSISTPGSADFRHYLTTKQWEARFSPAASQVSAARNWLRSEGFKVGAVSKDHLTVSASGTAGQVESAFGTGLGNYRVGTHTLRLATRTLSVPAAIAGSVAGAMGINQTIATPAVAATASSRSARTPSGVSSANKAESTSPFPPAPGAFVTAGPCGGYYNAKIDTVTPAFGHGYPAKVPYEVCGYKPGQYRSAYNVGSATGKGQTVAIIDAYGSATIAADSARYFSMNDPGSPFSNAAFTQDDATPFDDESVCSPSSWLTEQAIDVQAVHSTAPDAHILFVGAQDCENGLFAAEQNVIDNRMADVVTNSWADTGGDLTDDVATRTAYDDLFMLADTTGMTIQFSSGDDGDDFNLLGFSSANYPTSSPYVTGVGGTSMQVGSKGQIIGDLGWATGRAFKCTPNAQGVFPGCTHATLGTWLQASYDGGGGGFTSYNYAQPWYQAPVVPSTLALRNEAIVGPTPMRVVPDISLDADPSTGFLIGLHEQFADGKVMYGQTRYGGTSLASPLLAGIIADANQTGGVDAGFINPAIYHLNGTSGAITDIVPGGKQAQVRVDHGYTYISGASGLLYSFRELTYEGVVTYCDETGNCASRPNTLSTAKGYDSMTGLGTTGPGFITDLAGS
jgi:subtilase family serine protease